MTSHIHPPSIDLTDVFEAHIPHLDHLLMPTINRNSRLNNVTELQPPTEIIDSEVPSSPAPRPGKNLIIIE